MKKGSQRYWYLDENNNPVNVVVRQGEPVPENYTRGFKPIDPGKLDNRRIAISKCHKGKPKSLQQRLKMRDRKIGIKKSKDHKEHMSETHLLRHVRVKHLMYYQPELNFYNACKMEASMKNKVLNNMCGNVPDWYIQLLREHKII